MKIREPGGYECCNGSRDLATEVSCHWFRDVVGYVSQFYSGCLGSSQWHRSALLSVYQKQTVAKVSSTKCVSEAAGEKSQNHLKTVTTDSMTEPRVLASSVVERVNATE